MSDIQAEICIVLSDLHFGKITPFGFNLQEASRRIKSIPELVKNKIGKEPFAGFKIIFGGDLVEGEDIYLMQAAELDNYIMDQTRVAHEAFSAMLRELYNVFRKPIYCSSVKGNHGRIRGFHPNSNFDSIVMRQLAMELKNNTAICIDIEYGVVTTLTVGGVRGVLTHVGPKHMGTPAMYSQLFRKLRRHRADFWVHGHWHQGRITQVDDAWHIANGSLCGVDLYAEENGFGYDNARQAMFFGARGGLYGFDWLTW